MPFCYPCLASLNSLPENEFSSKMDSPNFQQFVNEDVCFFESGNGEKNELFVIAVNC